MAAARPLDDQVRCRDDDTVRWITLHRPDVANAIAPEQRDRLIDLLADASQRVDVRAVVLTATGGHFCAGADLRASRSPRHRPEAAPERVAGDIARTVAGGAQRLVASVLDCDKPVIAAVNGTAAGLGAHLALACDLVVAAEGARFVEVFVRRGLVPDGGGAWLLPRLVGLQRAKEMVLFGESLAAGDAARLGLVNRVVPAGDLEAAAREWAARLAAGPTPAIGLAKSLLNRSLDSDRATAFREEAMAQEINMGTHDAGEGVAAFVERREPRYRGW